MNILIISESFMIKESLSSLYKQIINDCNIDSIKNIKEEEMKNIYNFDLVTVHINSCSNDVVHVLSDIKKEKRNMKIVVLDTYKNKELLASLKKLNVDGYILDITDKEDFSYIINKIISGKKIYDTDLFELIIENISKSDINKLTKREMEVFNKVAKGLSNKEIANNLNVTDYTIKKHVSNILWKLRLKTRQDIIIYPMENNIT